MNNSIPSARHPEVSVKTEIRRISSLRFARSFFEGTNNYSCLLDAQKAPKDAGLWNGLVNFFNEFPSQRMAHSIMDCLKLRADKPRSSFLNNPFHSFTFRCSKAGEMRGASCN